jgi:hypothetical protein
MPEPLPPDDRRDEGLAALLAVEPLDQLTRRRLVTTAVRAAPARPRWRLAAAAAAVILVAAGTVVAVTGSDGPSPARRADAPTVAPRPPAGSPPVSASTATVAPVELGDFGVLDVAANLTRLRAAAAGVATQAQRGGAAASAAPQLGPARGCAPTLGPVRAVATGQLGGRPVVVLVVGTHLTAVAVDPCAVRALG